MTQNYLTHMWDLKKQGREIIPEGNRNKEQNYSLLGSMGSGQGREGTIMIMINRIGRELWEKTEC